MLKVNFLFLFLISFAILGKSQDTSVISNVIYKVFWDSSKIRYGFFDPKTSKPVGAAEFDSLVYRAIPEQKLALFLARKNKKWAMYDENHKELLAPQYDELNYNLRNGQIYAKQGNLYGILDKAGKPILEIAYQEILSDGSYFKVKKNDKFGLLDMSGKELVPSCFQSITDQRFLENSLLQINNKWSVLRWSAANPCQPTRQFEQIEYFNDYFIVKENGLWGVLDSTQKTVIEIKYLYVMPFFQKYLSTLLVVLPSKKMGLMRVEANGKVSTELPLVYDEIWVEDVTAKIKMRQGDKKDYAYEGKPYLKMKYNDVIYNDLINAFLIKKGKKWGVANSEGGVVFAPAYDKIFIIDGKNFLVQKKGKWGLVGGRGQNKIPLVYDQFGYNPELKMLFLKQIPKDFTIDTDPDPDEGWQEFKIKNN